MHYRRGYLGKGDERRNTKGSRTLLVHLSGEIRRATQLLLCFGKPGLPDCHGTRRTRPARRDAALSRVFWPGHPDGEDRKSTRLNSSHPSISYAVFCLKKKKKYY